MGKVAKTEVLDLSKPILISSLIIEPEDCLGNEWSLNDKNCLSCSFYDICMVIYLNKGNKEKIVNVKGNNKYFLDEIDWDNVEWDVLKRTIKDNPGEVILDDLVDVVKKQAKVIDGNTVIMRLNSWFISNSIKIKDGCLY